MTDTATPATTAETWTYVGRRPGASHVAEVWIDPTGTELYYRAGRHSKGYLIGGHYTARVVRDGERVTRYGQPAYDGPGGCDPSDVAAWRQADRAIDMAAEHDRLVKAQRAGGLDAALAPLIDVARSCRTLAAKDALVAEVLRQLYARW